MSNLLNGRYELHEQLGEGGMSVVFRATQLRLEREVAIKFIKTGTSTTGTTLAARFEREAKAIAQLNHPNITQVYDFDVSEDGRYYLVMERLHGMDLAQFIASYRPLALADTLEIIHGISSALGYAHERQIIHRDVKPSNVFITTQKHIKLMDFGLAKLATDTALTNSGSAVGTPKYFAPEQANGQALDHRSDIYSLGIVFYELLTGQLPYDSDNIVNLLLQHMTAPIPDPIEINPQLPSITTEIIYKMLAKEPTARYPSIAEFQDDVALIAQEQSPSGILSQVDLFIPPPSTSPTSSRPTIISAPTSNAMTLTNTIFQSSIRLPLIAVIVLVIGLLGALALVVVSQNGSDEPATTASNFVPDVAVAQPQEYLILVADWGDADQTLGQRIANTLRTSDAVAISPNTTVRIEMIDHVISSSNEALEIANHVGAHLVVWGVQDEIGVEVVFEDVFAEPRSASTIRFIIPNNEDYNDIVAQDTPIALRIYLGSMLLHHFVRVSDIDGFAGFGFSTLGTTNLRIIPATDLDRHILDMLVRAPSSDLSDMMNSLNNAIRLAPGDPTLLFMRSYFEGFYQNNLARSQADVDILRELVGDTNFALWAQMNIDLTLEDYEAVLALSEQLDTTIPGYALPYSYRQIALAMTGNYAAIQEEVQGDITELAIFGLPIWDIALAFSYETQGDESSLEAAVERILTNRALEASASFISSIDSPPVAFYLVGGYLAEVNGQALAAVLTYEQGLQQSPENYMLHWRRAAAAEQLSDITGAYRHYQDARTYAPIPLPVLTYREAVLIRDHAAQLPDDIPTACLRLLQAETEAQSNPVFYAPLLETIAQQKQDWNCDPAKFG